MNNHKYSAIGHRGRSLCNPISIEKIDQLIDLLALHPHQTAIDFGAGKAEFLIRLIGKYGINGTAIELEDSHITKAAEVASDRIDLEKLKIVIEDANQYVQTSNLHYDLSVCMGSTHAFGGLSQSLEALKKSTKPNGYVLVGDLYWKKQPDSDFLTFLEMSATDLEFYPGCITEGEQRGLTPLWVSTANQEEMDHYEWGCSMERENYIFAHPHDPDTPEIELRSRKWRQAYVKWGRDTFGFGLYLFRYHP